MKRIIKFYTKKAGAHFATEKKQIDCFGSKKEAFGEAKEELKRWAELDKNGDNDKEIDEIIESIEHGATNYWYDTINYSFKIFKIKKTFAASKKFFAKISENLEFDINDTINIEDNFKELDQENAFDSLQELLEENQAFDIDIIYHSVAIEYLAKNDSSLRDSLELAQDLGFELKNLSSETLASLHASSLARDEFQELASEINEFFNN
jgi:hypothetical protein